MRALIILLLTPWIAFGQVIETRIGDNEVYVRLANGCELRKTKGQIVAAYVANGRSRINTIRAVRDEIKSCAGTALSTDRIDLDFNTTGGGPTKIEWTALD